ncbi:phosphoribosylformylglycinamidine synthase, partial [Pasteurella multocida subsp. multocida str. Anand1_cattle]
MLQIFRGSPALSEFRLNQLAVRFQKANLPVSACYAEYIHFADLSDRLTEEETAKIRPNYYTMVPLLLSMIL